MEVRVDRRFCTGHGRCVVMAPSVFDLDDEGLSVVLAPSVPAEDGEAVQRAMRNCPEQAILLTGSA